MWNTKKLYELFKLQIEALNARVENNEWQIRKMLETIEELKNKNKPEYLTAPKDIKAYGIDDRGTVYEIDQSGKLTDVALDNPNKKGDK